MLQPDVTSVLRTVDRFYAAAHGAADWRACLDDMRQLLSAARTCITRTGPGGLNVLSHERSDQPEFCNPAVLDAYLGDPLAGVEYSIPEGRAYSWRQVADIGELRRRRLWGEHYGPLGLHDALNCKLSVEGDVILVFHATRHDSQPPFDTEELGLFAHLVTHLRQAGAMARRLGGAGNGLEQSGNALLVLDATCRLRWRNPAAGQLLGARQSPLLLSSGIAEPPAADLAGRFGALVWAVCTASGGRLSAGGAVALASEPDAAFNYVAHVSPMPQASSYGLPGERLALVELRRVHGADELDLGEALRAQFGLTAAETRLVLHLAAGHTLSEAAMRSGITFGTARNYLLQIFHKTRTHRQADLLALAAAMRPRAT